MQRTCLLHHRNASLSPAALPGHRRYDARASRARTLTSATRGDWRAEIEGKRSGGGSGNGASDGGSVAASTATLQPPPASNAAAPAAPPVSAASAAPESPWSQPSPKATTAAPAAPPPQKQKDKPKQQKPAAEVSREEPSTLPTFDLVEFLAEPKHQSTAFTVLASTSAILATLCIVEPEALVHIALPKASMSDMDETFMRIVGVTLAASASVEYSLKHAAESQLLKSATYQRLMAGCALKSAGFLAVLLISTPATWRLWNPLAWLSYASTAVAAGAINLAVISHSSGKGLTAPPLDSGAPQNPTAWGYTACVALYLLTVAACFAPETLFTGEPYSDISPLIKGIWSPGFLLAAVMAYVLKDAADRGRLGASTFKNLNLGLAALEYGYSIIFGSAILSDQVDIDLPALSNLGGALLIATFALYTYATAKK